MADRENVIYDLERCICHVPDACRDCSKYNAEGITLTCMENLMKDVLELLKEQEPVLWTYDGYNCFICSNCDFRINDEVDFMTDKPISFCPGCGRKVKWDE